MKTKPAVFVIASILASSLVACSPSQFDGHMDDATAAAAADDWLEAFASYTAASVLRPDDAAAAAGAQRAASHLVGEVPLASAADEVLLLRWLESTGRFDDALRVLGASAVTIPAGRGAMGSDENRPDEQPQRDVHLDAYAIDRYEVTNLQYAAFIASSGEAAPEYWIDGAYPEGGDLHPVVGVSWRQADSYCAAAGKRLPTEAEWERACRGPDASIYPWGDEWNPAAANVTLHPMASLDEAWPLLVEPVSDAAGLRAVGDFADGLSPFGVCNMAGNASEWVADWYDPAAYSVLGDVNPVGTGPEWNHSIRGGAWLFRHDDPALMADKSRCAFRNSSHMGADPRVGFRCAGSTS